MKGSYSQEVDGLVSLLNQLLDEQKRLRQQLQQELDATSASASSSSPSSGRAIVLGSSSSELASDYERNTHLVAQRSNHFLKAHVSKMRENRLLEIDKMIDAIQQEFHRLTGSADLVPTKVVKPTTKVPKRHKRSHTARKAEERLALVVPIDSCVRMLRSCLTTHHGEVQCVGIGTVDISVGIVAFVVFGARALAFQTTQVHKKLASARISVIQSHLSQRTNAAIAHEVRSAVEARTNAADWLCRLRATMLRHHAASVTSELEAELMRLFERYRAAKSTGKETAIAKIAKLVHSLLCQDLVPLEPMTDATALAILDRCEAYLTRGCASSTAATATTSSSSASASASASAKLDPSVMELLSDNRCMVVVVSAAYLWDLCCKPEKQAIFQSLTRYAQQFASRYVLIRG